MGSADWRTSLRATAAWRWRLLGRLEWSPGNPGRSRGPRRSPVVDLAPFLDEPIDIGLGRARPEAHPDEAGGDFRRQAHGVEHDARFHASGRAGAAGRDGDSRQIELHELAGACDAGHGVRADRRDAWALPSDY